MKRIIKTVNAPWAIGPYSRAVEANGTLYISGQIPVDPASGKIVEGGIREQTDRVLRNIGAVLDAAGYTYGDVVKTTCLLGNIADFRAMNEIYATFFPDDPPARSTIGVAGLPMGALLEIETIAVKA
jgi:2-iminobutanoate/2-iminopropanoate deaminase